MTKTEHDAQVAQARANLENCSHQGCPLCLAEERILALLTAIKPEPDRFCCEVTCRAAAEWRLDYGPHPDNYTEACTEHVGALLEPDWETTVTRIGV